MTHKEKQSKLIIISGPSGAGKNAAVRGVLKKLPNASRIVTCITRNPRPKENLAKIIISFPKKNLKKS